MRKFLKNIYQQTLNYKSRFLNTIFGYRDYRKFVIVSDARTGSTLLMALLNNHPEIIAGGEIFKQLKNCSCKEIWVDFFRKRPRQTKWLGFKLFYDHPWNSKDKEVWNFIENDKEIVVIHLIRENILRSYVSKQIGLKTKLWTENVHRPHAIKTEDKTVQIDPVKCLANLKEIENLRVQTAQRFSDHKIIPVTYEELNRDKNKVMNRIFKELNVEGRKIMTTMKKQNPEKLEDLVTNYDILKNALIKTKWHFCLDDNAFLKSK